MCQIFTPKMGSILGVGHLDPGSGSRIRGWTDFGVIWTLRDDTPRNDPKMDPFWGVFRGVIIYGYY